MNDICFLCHEDEPSGIFTSEGFLICDTCADSLLEDEED